MNEMSTSATTVRCATFANSEYMCPWWISKRHFSVNCRKGIVVRGNHSRCIMQMYIDGVGWAVARRFDRNCCAAWPWKLTRYFFFLSFSSRYFLCVFCCCWSPSPPLFHQPPPLSFSSPPSFHPSIDFLERPKDGFPQQQRVSAACADVLAYGLDRFSRRPIVIHFRVKSQREQHSDTPFASAIGVSF